MLVFKMITLWLREANGLPQVTCLAIGATKNRVQISSSPGCPVVVLYTIPCCLTLPWMPPAYVLQLDMSISGKRYLS